MECGHSGREENGVADARGTAVGRQNFRVDGFDRSNFGMNQRRVHESRRKSSEFFPMIRRAVPAARVGSIVVGRTGIMVKVPPR